MCVYNDFCGKAVAIEHDGTVFSCDHMVYQEYRLGNICTDKLTDMVLSAKQREFGFRKRELLPDLRLGCQYLADCFGECRKNRFVRTPDGQSGLNYLCPGLKKFFAYATPSIDAIVSDLRKRKINTEVRLPGR